MERVAYYGPYGRVQVCPPEATTPLYFDRAVAREVPDWFLPHIEGQSEWVIGCNPLSSLIKEGQGHVSLRRFGAIGDLLQLHTVIRAIERLLPGTTFSLETMGSNHAIFEYSPVFRGKGPIQGSIIVDGVMEVDHMGDPTHWQHRTLLLWRFFAEGEPVLSARKQIPLDWSLPTGPEEQKRATTFLEENSLLPEVTGEPLIAVQLRGSGRFKSLPLEQMRRITEALEPLGKILLIDPDHHSTWRTPRTIPTNSLDLLVVAELLKSCSLCVCFDSGILWLAHSACTPVVCLMGPTRPEERLSLHPLYQDGLVLHVSMEQMVSCTPCFEKATACSFKIPCMTAVSTDPLLEAIEQRVRTILSRGTFERNTVSILQVSALQEVS